MGQWLQCEGCSCECELSQAARHVTPAGPATTMSPNTSVQLLHLLHLLLSLPSVFPYCTWVGSNPYWDGAPSVQQVSLTSVRVSWPGLLQRADCADSLLVKFYKGENTNDFGMSDTLSVTTNSYIVRDVVPNLPYTFQVIAREEKGLLGVDYNKSPKTVFTTRKTNIVVEKDDPLPASRSSEKEEEGNLSSEEEVIPVYNPEPTNSRTIINGEIKDNDVLGMKLEVFMGIVIGSLIVVIVAIGIVYNCIKKNQSEKDIELQFDSDSEDDDDEEDDEEEEGELGRDNTEGEKYNMMLPLPEQKISDKMSPLKSPKFNHSLSNPT